MVKVFCDRCCAPVDKTKTLWEMAQSMNNGDYMPDIWVVKDCENEDKDYSSVVLCDNCQKELEQLIITFMSAK